jgi:uncharacterized membrane protein
MARQDPEATIWVRVHARQALVLGLLGSIGFLVVLALPLAAVIAFPAMSPEVTIAVYAAGLVIDAVVGIGLLVTALRYAARAARGELFTIPVVTPIVDRWFKLGDP